MTNIINFIFSKEAFSGVATIVAGLVAIVVYWMHKRDEKINAARIVLSEIRNAEQQISKIKNDGVVSDFSSILSFNSWQKYAHLFVKILDRDELDLVNNFYIASTLAEIEINRLKSFLPLAMEEKAKEIQKQLINFAKEGKDKYETTKKDVLEIIHKEDYWFLPNTPKDKLLHYLSNIQIITPTTAGQKLKKIAK
jgi:hypothetical protein